MLAPLAVSVVDCAEQMLGLFTLTVGLSLTVTVATAVAVHPLVVPVTVYVVVVVNTGVLGLATAARPPVQV